MMKALRGAVCAGLPIAWVMISCTTLFAGPVTYRIHVDTTSLAGSAGNLEFILNPGPAGPVDFAAATFYNFTTDGGMFSTVPPDFGNVSGSLPGPLVLDNSGPGADHAESFTFGSFFDVFVDFDVPLISPGAGSGSTLGVNVEDSGFTSALTAPPDFLVLIATDTAGNQTIVNNNPALAGVAAIPEPATLLLAGAGFLAVLWRARSRAHQFAINAHRSAPPATR